MRVVRNIQWMKNSKIENFEKFGKLEKFSIREIPKIFNLENSENILNFTVSEIIKFLKLSNFEKLQNWFTSKRKYENRQNFEYCEISNRWTIPKLKIFENIWKTRKNFNWENSENFQFEKFQKYPKLYSFKNHQISQIVQFRKIAKLIYIKEKILESAKLRVGRNIEWLDNSKVDNFWKNLKN